MTNGRETTPPPGFLTPPHIPNISTTERPPVTTTVFAATTPGNTSFAYRASTSTDLAPMINPAFMEPNPERNREVTPPLNTRSPRVRRQRERVVEFEEAPNKERSRIGRHIEGSILNYEDLKAKFRSHFSQQKRFTKTYLAVHSIKQREGESVRAFATSTSGSKRQAQRTTIHSDRDFVYLVPLASKGYIRTYTWIEAREVATNGALNDQRDNFERSRKSFWDSDRGQRSRDRLSPYRGPNHGFLSSLSKSPREILPTEKVARSFEQPPRMLGSRRSRDMSKFCYFHEDHGDDTNDCRQLRSQIVEDVRSGQLSYLVKGIKKERTKTFDSQQ
uniref:Reverse transcriptase domain-containing protein n=1 Tax=Tanacetum cinerariifolium TaxID=118510 RepID=A0A6L2JLL3_TANCI|nr:hypothetical protein [Tanacetum cinerariifolium]